MKNKKLVLAAIIVMMSTSFTLFAQENKKAAKARKHDSAVHKEIAEANLDSIADFQKFKKDAEARINTNQDRIIELKAKKYEKSVDLEEKYGKKVAVLEQKNYDLRMKIDGCNEMKSTLWADFKKQFNKELDELANSIKDITYEGNK